MGDGVGGGGVSFNLVIERLFVSGPCNRMHWCIVSLVSISLSSGFSFQAWEASAGAELHKGFNLVIKRLFISGPVRGHEQVQIVVSISLSSGFSFQDRCHTMLPNDTTSFNLVIERLFISGTPSLLR